MTTAFERLSGNDEFARRLILLLGEYRDSLETVIDPVVRDASGYLPVLATQRLTSGWRVFLRDIDCSESKWIFLGIRMVARLLTIEEFRGSEIVIVTEKDDPVRTSMWQKIVLRNPCIRAVLYSLPILSSECDKYPDIADGISAILEETFRIKAAVSRISFYALLESLRGGRVELASGHPLWGLAMLFYGIFWGEVIRRESGGVWHQPMGDGRPEVRMRDRTVRPFEQVAYSFTHGFCVPK